METFWEQLQGALIHNSQLPGTQLLFTGSLFWLLFTAVYALMVLTGRWTTARTGLMVAFSLFFYYKFSGWFVELLVGTALMDWAIGLAIHKERDDHLKTFWKVLSVTVNLGLLAYFKYTNFFVQSWWSVANPGESAPLYDILLPIGISYYSFKSISYILDVHGGDEPERNPLRYLAYVSFFPNILAGPISRKDEILPQLRKPLVLTREQAGLAVFFFVKGLFKKIVIADYLGQNFVNRIFDNPSLYSGLENLMATYAYGFQLYADFSGYIDMALGIALLMGFQLRPNFNEPFKAGNISDFWRRWHMTLSQWFNDYVFVPLSFAWRRWGRMGTLVAVLITFSLSGLWHGPHWGYILWGVSHGVVIAWEVASAGLRKRIRSKVPGVLYRTLSILLTYQYLAITYILFQAAVLGKDFAYMEVMYGKMFTEVDWSLMGQWLNAYQWVAVVLLLAVVLHFWPQRHKKALQTAFVRLPWYVQGLLAAAAVVLIWQVKSAALVPFVYLQF
ncbi:MAG: MBOAT family protein [Bacteroidetes bacterium]|nr:MBOAT family protein [Bacteroidota bacterium]